MKIDVESTVSRYALSGDLIAGEVRTTTPALLNAVSETEVLYYHLDHLNSTKVVTDKDGKADVRYEYRALGGGIVKEI